MKSRSIFIIGTFSILTFLGLVISNTKSITERNLSYLRESEKENGQSFRGAAEYTKLIKANPETGEINPLYVKAAYKELNNMSRSRAALLTWNFRGPDNVGGRTRTLIVDKDNPQILYAGGVSGGIFKSTTGGEVWKSVAYTPELGGLIISCGVQTINGDIYFGTGEQAFTRLANGDLSSGNMGGGIYKSTDRGATWSRLASTNPASSPRWENIQAIATSPTNASQIYAATQAGLYETSDGGLTWTAYPGSLSQRYIDVQVSPNGKTIFAATYSMSGCRIYRSIDRSNLTSVGGTVISTSTVRDVIAISPSNPNYVYVSAASRGSGNSWGANALEGIYQSTDNGDTWRQIVFGATEAEPFGRSGTYQGDYDQCIAVDPYNPKKLFVGGVDFYIYNEPFWYKGASTQEFYDPTKVLSNPYYVHADKHGIVFDTLSKPYKMYVVTDGGVAVSNDVSYQKYPKFKTININYTTSQFYALAASRYDVITGGTQDNGTFRIENNSISGKNGTEILSGDGFYTEISRIDPNICFSEVYYGALNRSKDGGKSQQSLKIGKLKSITTFPFNTPFRIWEDVVLTTFVDSTLPPPYTFDSMLHISKLYYADQNKIWLNLEAHDFAKDADEWYGITPSNFQLYPLCMEYTNDGNTLFVGGTTWQGGTTGYLYRITGLKNAVYTYNATSDFDPAAAGITTELIQSWSSMTVTGIGVSPTNDNNIVVTLGNYVGSTLNHVWLCKNALVSDPINNIVFTNIQGNLPHMPVYDAAIHSFGNGTDTIIITSEMGVFTTTNGGSSWSETNDGMERVPSYMIRQVHAQPWQKGYFYYIATHGRGIFSGSIGNNLSTPDKSNFILPEMSVFPNPAINSTNVILNLPKTSNVTLQVYDLNGRIIQTYNFKQANSGTNTYPLNTSTFKSGTYLVKASVDGKTMISKLMISK